MKNNKPKTKNKVRSVCAWIAATIVIAMATAHAEPSISSITYQTIGTEDAIVFEISNGGNGMFVLATEYYSRTKKLVSERGDDGQLLLWVDELLSVGDTFLLGTYSNGSSFGIALKLRYKGDYWEYLRGQAWYTIEVVEPPKADAEASAADATTTRLGASTYSYKYIDISGDGIPTDAAKFRIWVIDLSSYYKLYADLNLEREPRDIKNCRWYCITDEGHATYYEVVDANGQGLAGRWVYEGNITADMVNAKGELTLIPTETRKAARQLKMWCEKNGPQPKGGFGSIVTIR